jgi:tol-pal system protein YbgF
MRFIILLTVSFIFNAAFAEDTTEKINPIPAPITGDYNARLEKVERAVNNRALLDMLDLLESLKTEVSTLRGEIEVQTHTIEQLKQKQRELYTDVDNRLQRVEKNGSTNSSTLAASEDTAVTSTEDTASTDEESSEASTVADSENSDAEKKPDPAKAEAAYQKAFKLLKDSRYDQALVAFKSFLKDYPTNPFSDNAQYWLGETNYVMQKYELAINEYQALLNTYPDSKKVSHALLKIGYSYAELGNAADAKKTLEEVKAQYPGTTAARLATERLRKIDSEAT